MRIGYAVVGLLLAVSAGRSLAQERSSPYDTNPKCTERTTDVNSPDCVLEQEGQPRQTYPPGRKVAPPPPPKQPPSRPTPPPVELKRTNPGSG